MIHNAASVTRYVLTYETKDNGRAIFGAAQGRFTYATEAEAQSHLDAVTRNNSRAALVQICGSEAAADSLAVRAVECWPGHFDPKRTVFID